MPPKTKANGFMVFTLEWKGKYGRTMSLSEATSEAGKIWANMNADQRASYNNKAKEENKNKREKLTCTGASISQVEKERLDIEDKERQTKRVIEMTVEEGGQLEKQIYYFIMVNYFTKTLKDGVYVPAEVSLCKFSLKEGVHQTYHTLINPGVNIYGHHYEAQHHSDTTHNLPLPPNALGESNLGNIYNDILNFVRDTDSNNYHPVYTLPDSIHIVDSVLKYLKADEGANNVKLNVYPILQLFYTLKKATCDAGGLNKPTSSYITDAYFERDFFEFQTGIGCPYHEDIDKSRYCTQSYVTRWGFMFADYMCNDLAILMMAGHHCPVDTNVNAIVTLAPSTYNDAESFISVDSTATYGTKAVACSKLYYDDQKTSISEASKTYTVDFPALGGHRKKKSAVELTKARPQNSSGILNKSSEHNADNDDYCSDLNPWTSRSRNNVPRAPANAHFEIDYTKNDLNSDTDDLDSMASFGRGRTTLINSTLNTTNVSSYGRGRYTGPLN